jgi:hypothetical protein
MKEQTTELKSDEMKEMVIDVPSAASYQPTEVTRKFNSKFNHINAADAVRV